MIHELFLLLRYFIVGILNLHIPGTDVSFLELAVAIPFLFALIRVFKKIFNGGDNNDRNP